MNERIEERILRLREVKNRTGLSTSTIYAWMKQRRFPKPINLGNRSVGWPESRISAWINSRVEHTQNICT